MMRMNKAILINIALLFCIQAFAQKDSLPGNNALSIKKLEIVEHKRDSSQLENASVTGKNDQTSASTAARVGGDASGLGVTNGSLDVSLTGSATYTIPVTMPPGINGVQPKVSLVYSSQAGNGIAGWGWNITGLSTISRTAPTKFHDGNGYPINFDANDRFALDGQRLRLKSGTYGADGAEYETEGYSQLKITSHGVSPYGASYGPAYFKVSYPDGSVAFYGNSDNCRTQMDYAIAYIENAQGIRASYSYLKANNGLSISSILFGSKGAAAAINEIQFVYGARQRPEQSYTGGIFFSRNNYLSEINVKGNGTIIRNYKLSYNFTATSNYERLISVQEKSADGLTKPAVTFNYTNSSGIVANGTTYSLSVGNIEQRNAEAVSLDFTGDGKMDFLVYPTTGTAAKQKFWLFTDIQNSSTQYGWEVGTGAFIDIFPSTWLTWNNKILSGQGITVVQNEGTDKVKFKVYSNSAATPVLYQYEKQWTVPVYQDQIYCDRPINQYRVPLKYLSGDFNGDGLTDVMAVTMPYTETYCYEVIPPGASRIPPDCECENYTSSWSNVYFINLDRRVTDPAQYVKYTGNLQQAYTSSDKLYTADFNGDGKTDILHVQSGKVTVYAVDAANNLQMLWQTSDSRFTSTYPLLTGDFNGDGKTDLLTATGKDSYLYAMFLCTGKAFVKSETSLPFQYKEAYWDGGDGVGTMYTYNLIPTDANGDGKTDILDYRAVTRNSGINGSQSVAVYLGNSSTASTTPGFTYSGSNTRNGDLKHYPVPVFVTSGRPNYNLDFATISDNRVLSFEFRQDTREDVLLRSVTNNGITHSITYHNIDPTATTTDGQSVYTQDYGETYPYTEIAVSPGTKIVTRLEKFGIAPGSQQTFSYHSAVSHADGLGFLGFKVVNKSNWFTAANNRMFSITHCSPALRGAVVKEFTSLSTYIPSTITTVEAKPAEIVLSTLSTGEKTVEASWRIVLNEGFTVDGAAGTFIAQTVNNATGVNDGATSNDYISRTDHQYQTELRPNKVFINVPVANITKDLLSGTNTSQYYTYDAFFNAVEQAAYYSNDGSKITRTTYSNSTGTDYYIGRPVTVTNIAQAGSEVFSTETQYTYTGYLPTTIKTKGQNTGFATENRVYDGFGNITQKTRIPESGTARTVKYEYDASGRFLTKTTDADGLATIHEYDSKTGNITKKITPLGLPTSFEYDGWGRHIKITDYLGNKTVSVYQIMGNDLNIVETSDDGKSIQTYYDALGRPYRWFGKNVSGQWVEKQARYDHLDRKVEESEPYIGSLTQWNKTEYDVYGRVIKVTSHTGKITTYSYNGLSITVNDGTKSITTRKNAMGHTIQQTDPGGTISFAYFGNGNLKSTTFDGNTVSIEQDGWGRKTKLVDPAAGTYTYAYNGFGEIITETTPKGTTTYVYDAAGKLINRKITGDNTNIESVYSYDATTRQITSSTMTNADGNNSTYSYTYDTYKRIISTTESNPLASFVKTYTYDNFGRLLTEDYKATSLYNSRTASKKIRNTYANGALKTVTDDASGEQIWSLNSLSPRGQVKEVALGTQLIQTNTFDAYGFPTELKVVRSGTEVMKQTYSFNVPRATLSTRNNTTLTWNESFDYDNLDRLTTFNDNSGNKSHVYDNKGRITTNSSLGTYGYSGNSYQHASVNLIPAARPLYSSRPLQQANFNAFKQPVEIREEGRDRVGFQYNDLLERAHMYYGSDAADKMQRPYRRHYSNDGRMEITYHAPTDKTSFVIYLDGNPYTASAIWKQEQTPAQTLQNLYFLQRDYLGSIIMITDKNGTVSERRQFDAWGNVVKLQNGAGGNLSAFQILDRGFTGHEHLLLLPASAGVGYALINMNGRLYDPYLHAFVSPDNNMQDPSNSQMFNRYAYALNNPLTYVDQNGEFLWVPVIIGAVIGAYSGGVMANNGQFNPFKWDYSSGKTWGFMIGGAIVGGISGGVGAYISASGIPFANTLGMAASSLISSVGTHIYTGGKTDISISFGFGSFNFTTGEFNYLGKEGNSFIENVGFAFGALANVQDAVAGFHGTDITVKARPKVAGHSQVEGKFGKSDILISVGPIDPMDNTLDGLKWEWQYVKEQLKGHAKLGENVAYIKPNHPNLHITLHNVNGKILSTMTENLNNKLNLLGTDVLKYGAAIGCVNYSSRALFFAGVLNVNALLPVTAPVLLNAELYLRAAGIISAPILIGTGVLDEK